MGRRGRAPAACLWHVAAGARGSLCAGGRVGRAHAPWRAVRVSPGTAASSGPAAGAAAGVAGAPAGDRTRFAVLRVDRERTGAPLRLRLLRQYGPVLARAARHRRPHQLCAGLVERGEDRRPGQAGARPGHAHFGARRPDSCIQARSRRVQQGVWAVAAVGGVCALRGAGLEIAGGGDLPARTRAAGACRIIRPAAHAAGATARAGRRAGRARGAPGDGNGHAGHPGRKNAPGARGAGRLRYAGGSG